MVISDFIKSYKRLNYILNETRKPIPVIKILKHLNQTKLGFCLIKKGSSFKIFTDGDFRRKITNNNNFILANSYSIKSKSIKTIDVHKTLFDAYNIMNENKINVLIVTKSSKVYSYVTFHEISGNLSPERLNLDKEKLDKYEIDVNKHLLRYKFASCFINKKMDILDAACGTGYGSKILSKNAKSVLGLDYSKDAILLARSNYKSKNIKFLNENILNHNFKKKFDAIISLETLEHLDKKQSIFWLKKCRNLLKKKSIFLCSSPLLRVREGKPFITNPHHLHEMRQKEFFNNLKKIFMPKSINFFIQNNDHFIPHTDQKEGLCMAVLSI